MPDFSDTERRLIDLLEFGVKFQLKCFVNSNLSSIFAPKLNDRLMVHVNETIVIKSSSVKMAEWVKRLKALLRSLHTP